MKALIVSYYFVPSSCSNAKRAYYVTKGLLEAGWDVDVVSSYRLMSKDQSELIKHPNLTIQRIDDTHDRFSRSGKGAAFVATLLRGMLWPDSFLLWAISVARKIDTSKYDRILICIMPISMLIFAWIKSVNDRWIFDYSESFSPCMSARRKSLFINLMYPLLRPLQRYVLRKAGVVLFTAESTRKEYLECGLVDEQKAVHIPLFYDDSIYKNILPPKDRFIIGYTGQFGAHKGVRSPDVFFEALSLFLTRNPEARKATRFVFHGPWNPIHTPLIRHYTLEDVVEINDPVPYASYLELLEEAVVLLLVASSDQNLFVPGKMLDYFAAKRPILAFVPEDSETRFILKEAGMDDYAADEYDAEGGVRCLERLWKGWASGRILCGNSRAEQWSYSFQMPRILKLFTRK